MQQQQQQSSLHMKGGLGLVVKTTGRVNRSPKITGNRQNCSASTAAVLTQQTQPPANLPPATSSAFQSQTGKDRVHAIGMLHRATHLVACEHVDKVWVTGQPTSSLVNMPTKCGKASMRWWWMRQQKPPPASAASRAGRKSAKALVRASSLATQNWSRVCTRDAITSTRTALLSSPNRFRNVLQSTGSIVRTGAHMGAAHMGAHMGAAHGQQHAFKSVIRNAHCTSHDDQ